ncbi:MAG TPA: S-methyl-5'-thioadenosine phosphorylase [Rectinema sp.]|nr:S-methyl-5'-thioadenosine phosphorylase [Rectinema sp.]
MEKAKVGIIGGSGLYEIEGAEVVEEIKVDTPWGSPSDLITIAKIGGVRTAFLPRHGKGHFLLPTEVNSRANIAALKMLGVREIVAFSAVGSLKEDIHPRDFVLPSQIIDRTKDRPGSSFFGEGIVAHLSFADPFCTRLCSIIEPLILARGLRLHTDETLICMEGPAFSTRAESQLYRSWGAGIINMSVLPEAKLAREAGICYAMICMATDYDCWKMDHADVTVDMVVQNLNANSAHAKALILDIVPALSKDTECSCHTAMKGGIMTAPSKRNPETVIKLKTIFPEL